MDDSDDFYRESKRQCTRPIGHNNSYGPPTTPSYIPSPWGAQNDSFDGSGNTLHQNSLYTDLSGHFEPSRATQFPSWSNLLDFGPGYPIREPLDEAIPLQSDEVEMPDTRSWISMEGLTDARLSNISTQTDTELGIGWHLDDISQEAAAVIEEPDAQMVTNKYVHEVSKLPTLCETYIRSPLQFTSDSSLNLEGDEISQKRWGRMVQASGFFASESVGTVVHDEQPCLGQSISVFWLNG